MADKYGIILASNRMGTPVAEFISATKLKRTLPGTMGGAARSSRAPGEHMAPLEIAALSCGLCRKSGIAAWRSEGATPTGVIFLSEDFRLGPAAAPTGRAFICADCKRPAAVGAVTGKAVSGDGRLGASPAGDDENDAKGT
jgi:hypothetical protein